MQRYTPDWTEFVTKGKVELRADGDTLRLRTLRSITRTQERDHFLPNSYAVWPQPLRLPLSIEATVNIDAPGLYMMLGQGYVSFGTLWNDNRRIKDPSQPSTKTRMFHNHIPLGQDVRIQILYGAKAMRIMVDGQERFFSKREPYMKADAMEALGREELFFGVAASKHVNLVLRDLEITLLDADPPVERGEAELPAPITRNIALIEGEKPALEACIRLLPEKTQEQVRGMDALLRGLSPMKFRRQFEKYGNRIAYVASDDGFSYALHLSGDRLIQMMQWYVITNSTPDKWHRKADHMEDTLDHIARTDPALAQRLFDSLIECEGCAPGCRVGTVYGYNGQKKKACHGSICLTMRPQDFKDAKAFLLAANDWAMKK